jgi:hypothetical protein
VVGSVVGSKFQGSQGRHDSDGYRVFDTIDRFGDRMVAQATHPCQFIKQNFRRPPPKILIHNLACAHRLRQIGHEDLRLSSPIVAPTLSEHHGDISKMAHAGRRGLDPEGAVEAAGCVEANLGIPPAGQMYDQGFEAFPIRKLPSAWENKHVPIIKL